MRSNRVTQSDIGSSRPYKTVSDFLEEDSFTGFTQEHLFIKRFIKNAWGQDIAALSNMAEAIAGLYALELIDDETARHRLNMIVNRALHKSVRPYSGTLENQSSLGLYGYYLEHLNIILGHFQAAGDNKHLTLNERITVHLRDLSLEAIERPRTPSASRQDALERRSGRDYSFNSFVRSKQRHNASRSAS